MCRWRFVLLAVVFLLCSHGAARAEKTYELYLEPFGQYAWFPSDQELDSSSGYGFNLGLISKGAGFVDSIGFEVGGSQVSTRNKADGSDVDVQMYHASCIYDVAIKDRQDIVPFFSVGAGWVTADENHLGTDRLQFVYGGGLKYFSNRYLAWRLDGRHWLTHDDGVQHSLTVTAGLQVVFGKRWSEKRVVKKDRDKDGVPDSMDQCPDSPRGVDVDEKGCREIVVDTDGDGVRDEEDQCPATPAEAEIDHSGCPKDSDQDGIPDFRDGCPGTPRGVKVAEDGCV